ncbi:MULTISPECIES: hypothetical protein [Dickeya]|uniref:Uncharacterized protein n=1 Tax=Dickeya oryzae TaxID=1240404 RepID=A0AB39IIC5_9GAMM|nr:MULTISPECIES: hypothetical protein [Dickeya]MBP2849156.1 hypothetical protein [Dickeya oryzae]MCA6989661.1 hypothetical protein [Dickeya oryzae]MCA6994386.1 hypothetical protein [Dickeya oryzae]
MLGSLLGAFARTQLPRLGDNAARIAIPAASFITGRFIARKAFAAQKLPAPGLVLPRLTDSVSPSLFVCSSGA